MQETSNEIIASEYEYAWYRTYLVSSGPTKYPSFFNIDKDTCKEWCLCIIRIIVSWIGLSLSLVNCKARYLFGQSWPLYNIYISYSLILPTTKSLFTQIFHHTLFSRNHPLKELAGVPWLSLHVVSWWVEVRLHSNLACLSSLWSLTGSCRFSLPTQEVLGTYFISRYLLK